MKNEEIKFIIDEGNYLVKIAAFRGNKWLDCDKNRHVDEEFLLSFLHRATPEALEQKRKAIFSSVRKVDAEKINLLSKLFDVLHFTHTTPIPIHNAYETPETLGLDRLAAAIGASALFKKTPILIIDAGTCITYDFIDAEKIYWGGGIMPGLQMKLQALHNFTEKLPLLSIEMAPSLQGLNTRDAILAGTINGTMLSLDSVIQYFANKFSELKVVLCGGDSAFLQNNLKNDTFAEPELALYGLKQILDFNEN